MQLGIFVDCENVEIFLRSAVEELTEEKQIRCLVHLINQLSHETLEYSGVYDADQSAACCLCYRTC